MATLNGRENADMRREAVKDWPSRDIDFGKPTINAVFQQLETWFESTRGTLSTVIDSASGAKRFSPDEKRRITRAFLKYKFGKGG